MIDIVERLKEIDRVFVQKGFNFHILIDSAAEIQNLRALLQRYVSAYPAFHMEPVGVSGSEKRIERENLMALEDAAVAALKRRKALQLENRYWIAPWTATQAMKDAVDKVPGPMTGWKAWEVMRDAVINDPIGAIDTAMKGRE